ncbi:helix-turn-helix transcriptional regulator [Paraurantiacibacter namhicola]|uniref:Putative HTH-type transcriptional regulator n=1 Tax=Paraurantiacibacter namhicola TaxID=645517 RepID=A0A1C7D729_9SPHN|nr:LuxR family transcriptional regulator [Paraurantiacibacter namhicola]ANU07255.1 Putative HTH-type transcriptional regulator [Paraurantiacibacter namhicola]
MTSIRKARSRSDLDWVVSSPTAATLWRRIEQAAADLGFPLYIYVFVRRDGTRFHHTNIPARYYAGPEHDPFLVYCCNNLGHTLTGAEFLPDYRYLSEGEQAFIQQARGSGMRSGIGIPVRTRSNPEYGGFNFGTHLPRAEFEAGPLKQLETLRTLCLAAQQRIEELGVVAEAPDQQHALAMGSLTPREREIFDLLAIGLPRADMADRAGISPHTASTHIKRIYRKLGVRSRAEAMTLRMQ